MPNPTKLETRRQAVDSNIKHELALAKVRSQKGEGLLAVQEAITRALTTSGDRRNVTRRYVASELQRLEQEGYFEGDVAEKIRRDALALVNSPIRGDKTALSGPGAVPTLLDAAQRQGQAKELEIPDFTRRLGRHAQLEVQWAFLREDKLSDEGKQIITQRLQQASQLLRELPRPAKIQIRREKVFPQHLHSVITLDRRDSVFDPSVVNEFGKAVLESYLLNDMENVLGTFASPMLKERVRLDNQIDDLYYTKYYPTLQRKRQLETQLEAEPKNLELRAELRRTQAAEVEFDRQLKKLEREQAEVNESLAVLQKQAGGYSIDNVLGLVRPRPVGAGAVVGHYFQLFGDLVESLTMNNRSLEALHTTATSPKVDREHYALCNFDGRASEDIPKGWHDKTILFNPVRNYIAKHYWEAARDPKTGPRVLQKIARALISEMHAVARGQLVVREENQKMLNERLIAALDREFATP